MTEKQASPGWYPDPAGDTEKLRYWNGAQWTDELKDKETLNTNTSASLEERKQQSVASGSWVEPALLQDTSKFAIYSLVVGLLSFALLWLMLLFGYIGGVIAIVFGSKGLPSSRRNLSKIGIALGIIVIGITLVLHIFSVAVFLKSGMSF